MTRAGDWPETGFAGRLRQLREEAGLSQDSLARAAGLATTTVYRLEAGKNEPAWPVVLVLAKALNVTPDAFLVPEGDITLEPPKRPIGRPRKVTAEAKDSTPPPEEKRPQGRPKKAPAEETVPDSAPPTPAREESAPTSEEATPKKRTRKRKG